MKHEDPFSLHSKVAVVTGAAGLIGRGLVSGLTEAGASVVAADLKRVESVAFKRTDITREESVSDLIDYVNTKYGRLDIWVNSAYPRTSDWGVGFEEVRLSSWRKNVDMHLGGYFVCCQKAVEYMKDKRCGVIINLSSIYGMIGPDFSIYKGTDMTVPAAYSAIKGGVIAFTRYLAAYCGRYNIRVNCVSPGGVYDNQPDLFVQRYAEKTPLGRMAKADDVVGAVLYLVSDASGYVTGYNLVVDGGRGIT